MPTTMLTIASDIINHNKEIPSLAEKFNQAALTENNLLAAAQILEHAQKKITAEEKSAAAHFITKAICNKENAELALTATHYFNFLVAKAPIQSVFEKDANIQNLKTEIINEGVLAGASKYGVVRGKGFGPVTYIPKP